jgi:hypothetical protein
VRPKPSLRGNEWSHWPDESLEAFEEAKASLPAVDGTEGASILIASAEIAQKAFGDSTWLRVPFAHGAERVCVSVIDGKTCYTALAFTGHWCVRSYYPPMRVT